MFPENNTQKNTQHKNLINKDAIPEEQHKQPEKNPGNDNDSSQNATRNLNRNLNQDSRQSSSRNSQQNYKQTSNQAAMQHSNNSRAVQQHGLNAVQQHFVLKFCRQLASVIQACEQSESAEIEVGRRHIGARQVRVKLQAKRES